MASNNDLLFSLAVCGLTGPIWTILAWGLSYSAESDGGVTGIIWWFNWAGHEKWLTHMAGSQRWLGRGAAGHSAGTVDHSPWRGPLYATILFTGCWLVCKESAERKRPMGKHPQRPRKKPLSFLYPSHRGSKMSVPPHLSVKQVTRRKPDPRGGELDSTSWCEEQHVPTGDGGGRNEWRPSLETITNAGNKHRHKKQ